MFFIRNPAVQSRDKDPAEQSRDKNPAVQSRDKDPAVQSRDKDQLYFLSLFINSKDLNSQNRD